MTTSADSVLDAVHNVARGMGSRDEKLLAICELLCERNALYDWVGFYLVDTERSETLILGPYVGEPTDHVIIPFGVGICGQSAASKKPFIVDDVTVESNYLSCSLKVKSEIVIPVLRDGEYVAQLDIDSHTASAFTPADRETLTAVCDVVSTLF